MENQDKNLYTLVTAKALELEMELKRLERWQNTPLPKEMVDSMGAFGENTMTFEQWLQFVLIARIQQIVTDHDEFPSGSMLATYAVRAFDGDQDASQLHQILNDLDHLINTPEASVADGDELENENVNKVETISVGDTTIPTVVYTLAELLPQFEGEYLESQLQTFDTFLEILAPSARPLLSDILQKAAQQTFNSVSKQRIINAAMSITQGGRAAPIYNHNDAMRKHREEHKKNYPF